MYALRNTRTKDITDQHKSKWKVYYTAMLRIDAEVVKESEEGIWERVPESEFEAEVDK